MKYCLEWVSKLPNLLSVEDCCIILRFDEKCLLLPTAEPGYTTIYLAAPSTADYKLESAKNKKNPTIIYFEFKSLNLYTRTCLILY